MKELITTVVLFTRDKGGTNWYEKYNIEGLPVKIAKVDATAVRNISKIFPEQPSAQDSYTGITCTPIERIPLVDYEAQVVNAINTALFFRIRQPASGALTPIGDWVAAGVLARFPQLFEIAQYVWKFGKWTPCGRVVNLVILVIAVVSLEGVSMKAYVSAKVWEIAGSKIWEKLIDNKIDAIFEPHKGVFMHGITTEAIKASSDVSSSIIVGKAAEVAAFCINGPAMGAGLPASDQGLVAQYLEIQAFYSKVRQEEFDRQRRNAEWKTSLAEGGFK